MKNVEMKVEGNIMTIKVDEPVKSRISPQIVIPAKTEIKFYQIVKCFLDSRMCGNNDFLRERQG